jgi:hypothetical protein
MSDANCGLLVSPDTFELGLGDRVIEWLSDRVPVIGVRWIEPLDRLGVQALYAGTGDWNPGWELKLTLLRWAPSALVEIAPEHWADVTNMKGPSTPWLLVPGTLRSDLGAIGTVLSLVHAADTVERSQEDLRRLGSRPTTRPPTSSEARARSFSEALARAATGLGRAADQIGVVESVARGPESLAALQSALDAIHGDSPDCVLADWRNWGEHTASAVRAQLLQQGASLDAWSDLVLTSGIYFSAREGLHAPK